MTRIFRTIHGKLTLALLALLLLVGALFVELTIYTTRMYMREVNQHLNRALASELATHLIDKNLLRADPSARNPTRAEIKQSMVLNPDIEIYILDTRGHIVDFSAAPGAVRLQSVSLGPVRRFIAGVGPLPIFGDDPRYPGEQKIFSAQRIPIGQTKPQNGIPQSAKSQKLKSGDRLQGYIYIILGGQQYDAAASAINRSYILRWSLLLTLGVLGVAALIGALSFGFLTRRLRRLTRSMEEFATRHFAGEVGAIQNSQGDEIEWLERFFGQMSGRIEAQLAGLQQADAYRREAVSNVSHDLRTPLAALQGYLETLQMKENTLSETERREYIATATRHAQRLGKLVSELFNLARLESGALELHLEVFSLAELVQDVTQQFELAARTKGVHLEADLDDERPFVRADIGLIERALENLIDNALRHTPSGGRVNVVLVPADERAAVCVSDTGKGIAPQELPHIFDRYYRAPRIAGSVDSQPSSGVGLGLAITQLIVELHGGSIEAHSTPGEGATFIFTLPIASSP